MASKTEGGLAAISTINGYWTKTHLGLVLLLEHRQEPIDDLIGHTFYVCTPFDGTDRVDVRHLLEDVVSTDGHAHLGCVKQRKKRVSRM